VVKPYRMQWEVKSNAKDLIESGKDCDDSDNADKLYDAAINLLNTVIRLNPKDASAFALRGEAYENKGQHDAAISDFTECIMLSLNEGEYFAYRGRVYRQLGQKKQAIQDFEKSLSLYSYDWVRKELDEIR